MVAALDIIIEKFQAYIAPHASALTQQLTRCFMEYASVRFTLYVCCFCLSSPLPAPPPVKVFAAYDKGCCAG